MFKKILVPVDFSRKSHHSLSLACQIAQDSGGEIDLFHVVQAALMARLTEGGDYESLGKGGQQILSEVLSTNRKKIEKLADEYRVSGHVINTRLKIDEMPDKIAKHIHQEDYDLLVVGGDLNYQVNEMIKENHSEEIVRLAKKAVLVVNQPFSKQKIEKIVVPTNLTDSYGGRIEKLKQIQAFFGAELEFVYLNTPAEFKTTYDIDSLIKDFQKRHDFKNCQYHVISDKGRKKGILRAAEYLKADMIGLLSLQSKSLMKFFRGDITEFLVNHSPIPIMVLNVQR